MSKIITLTPEQVKAHPLIRKKGNKDIPILFYDFLAEHEHIPDNTMIQCTHVNIAKNIQDAWYNYVQEQELMSEYEFTNVLLWKGPKAVVTRIYSSILPKSILYQNFICLHGQIYRKTL